MPTPVVSVHPITVGQHDRGVRVSAPVDGANLPVVVFSHGFGQSARSYEPLAGFWAAHGFVVVQPTHPDSRTLGRPLTPDVWRVRVDDLRQAIDSLEALEAAVPGLRGRVDHRNIAVAGHSWGAQTASELLGARTPDGEDLRDARVSRGVLLAITGRGGADLTPFAAEHFPFMSPSFDEMKAPALIVAGDADQSQLSTRGPDWFTDAYHLSPGDKTLLTVFGGEHSLGGISGYESAETTDENPARVALIQRVTTAFLRGEPLESDASLGGLDRK
ncbi:alpha/beta hydrolase family protein [Dactylosporangium sp. CS-033363]|uniref:alpha/beta hydrolase family protein n=1 Tax=Dactylosporangium sp. CS-033363 TaxID=3239935 RepID=UPI003D8E4611